MFASFKHAIQAAADGMASSELLQDWQDAEDRAEEALALPAGLWIGASKPQEESAGSSQFEAPEPAEPKYDAYGFPINKGERVEAPESAEPKYDAYGFPINKGERVQAPKPAKPRYDAFGFTMKHVPSAGHQRSLDTTTDSTLHVDLSVIQSNERAKLLHNQALVALGLQKEEQHDFRLVASKRKRRHRFRALFAQGMPTDAVTPAYSDTPACWIRTEDANVDADPTVYVPPLHIADTPPGVKPKRYNRGLEEMLQRNALEAARIQQADRDAKHKANSRVAIEQDVAVAAMHLVRTLCLPSTAARMNAFTCTLLAPPPATRRPLAPLTPGRAVVDPA